MFVKNVHTEDIKNYNCGFGNIVSIKAGETIEIEDERAVKSLLRLLSPRVEVVEKAAPKPKKVEVKKEKEEPKKVEVKREGFAPRGFKKRVIKK